MLAPARTFKQDNINNYMEGIDMHKSIPAVLLITVFIFAAAFKGYAEIDWEKGDAYQVQSSPVDVAVSADGKYTFILAKDNKVYVYADDGTLQGSVPVDKSTTSIDVSPQGDKLYTVSANAKHVQQINVDFVMQIDISGSPFKGKANAPVAIVEFSDFECPYCSKVGPIFDEILKRNPDTVKIVFKHFPLGFHKNAIPAALSSIAAQSQGKFWEYHDLLFENQKQLSQEHLQQYARQLGLDMTTFNNALRAPSTRQQLAQDMQIARNIGVRGTPSLYINGRKIKDRSVAAIQQMIDQELAKTKKK